MSWPLQNAHPAGAKLHARILISATNGLDISYLSGLRREDAEQRNDERDAQVRLHVVVRLAAAGVGDRGRRDGRGVGQRA